MLHHRETPSEGCGGCHFIHFRIVIFSQGCSFSHAGRGGGPGGDAGAVLQTGEGPEMLLWSIPRPLLRLCSQSTGQEGAKKKIV